MSPCFKILVYLATSDSGSPMSTHQKIWSVLLAITTVVVAVMLNHSDPADPVSADRLKAETLETEKTALLTKVDELSRERRQLDVKVTSLEKQVRISKGDLSEPETKAPGLAQKQSPTRSGTEETGGSSDGETPFAKAVSALASRAGDLNRQFQAMPDKDIPELQYLDEGDWLHLAKAANLDSPAGVRKALADARQQAKVRFAPLLTNALAEFSKANNAQPPISMAQLKPYFSVPVDDATLNRYQIVTDPTGKQRLGSSTYISEVPPVDPEFDSHFEIGTNGWSSASVGQTYTEKIR